MTSIPTPFPCGIPPPPPRSRGGNEMAQEKEKYDVKSGIIQGPILGKLAEVFSGSFPTTKVVHA